MLLPPGAQPDSPTSPCSDGAEEFDLTKLVEPMLTDEAVDELFEQGRADSPSPVEDRSGATPFGNAPPTPELPTDIELFRAFRDLRVPASTPTA